MQLPPKVVARFLEAQLHLGHLNLDLSQVRFQEQRKNGGRYIRSVGNSWKLDPRKNKEIQVNFHVRQLLVEAKMPRTSRYVCHVNRTVSESDVDIFTLSF